jgi:FdhD protein
MNIPAFFETSITKFSNSQWVVCQDKLAIEEPLEIRLQVQGPAGIEIKNISITMRTPGNDKELALGFLFTEQIIAGMQQVTNVFTNVGDENIVMVQLVPGFLPDVKKMERNFYTTSSCGVCGKASIEALNISSAKASAISSMKISADTLFSLGNKLRRAQEVFEFTGGLHAAAIFDLEGNLLLLREDVGRHNALDKLIGSFVLSGKLPLDKHILMLSGRASFELLQKAGAAGIKLVASVGAPSSLAVQTAKEFGITLIGFLRNNGFNVYNNPENVLFSR